MTSHDATADPAVPRLLGPAEVRELAERLGVRPTKQRGQNFVIDANTVRRIVRASGVGPDDVVVEVGPGLGSLTLALLAATRRVVAVEIDPVLAAGAAGHDRRARPGVRRRAARWWRPTRCACASCPGPPPTALVANLPYNVSVPVLLHLLALLPSLERGMVMVQAEVADRLVAPPGSRTYGVPSAKAAWFADAAPRRLGGALGVLARPQRRQRAGGLGAPRPAGDLAPRAPTSSPSSTPRSPSAARPCAPR